MSFPAAPPASDALDVLSRFRVEFYGSLYARADVLFELTDAVLCTDGPVKTLVELSLAHEMRRGHGALYAALDKGWCEPARMRRALADLPLPRITDGRIALAVDVSNWLRPDANTSPDRLFCRRADRSCDQLIRGWPYSFVAALESGRTDDATTVTAAQLREVVTRIIAAGHWTGGDPDILIVMDAGYDSAYLSHALADLPVVLTGRLRSDRVMLRDAGPARSGPRGGRPRKHGGVLTFAKPESWHAPEVTTVTDTTSYGKAEAMAWDRMHPRLTHRGPWLEHAAKRTPAAARHVDPSHCGTTARRGRPQAGVAVVLGHRSHNGHRKPVVANVPAQVDIEHTFRMIKQTLGWTAPRVRHPATADLWTWLIIAAHTQLRLARPLAEDLRRPWERPVKTERLSPARVRRGFRPPEGGEAVARLVPGDGQECFLGV